MERYAYRHWSTEMRYDVESRYPSAQTKSSSWNCLLLPEKGDGTSFHFVMLANLEANELSTFSTASEIRRLEIYGWSNQVSYSGRQDGPTLEIRCEIIM